MPTFEMFERVWFLTWTTYGTWLPGDARGYVSPKFERNEIERRNNVLGSEYDKGGHELRQLAMTKLSGPPVWLETEQACILRTQFEETARYRGWTIVIGAVMSNHVHLLVGVAGDPEPSDLMQDFKSYGSRSLNRRFSKPKSGTWWTEQGSKRKVSDARHFERVIAYVTNQHAPLALWRSGDVSPL